MKTLKEQNDEKAANLLGKRVLMLKPHPWAGEVGQIVKFDQLGGKHCAIVELDNTVECAVFNGREVKIL